MGFARPTRSVEGKEFFRLAAYRDELAVFKVNNEDGNYVPARFPNNDPRGTVWADVTIITGPGAGKVFPNAEIGGDHVYEALAEFAGTDTLVLGRIVQGEIGGKPYFINDPTPEDEEFAEEFLKGQVVETPAPAASTEEVPY